MGKAGRHCAARMIQSQANGALPRVPHGHSLTFRRDFACNSAVTSTTFIIIGPRGSRRFEFTIHLVGRIAVGFQRISNRLAVVLGAAVLLAGSTAQAATVYGLTSTGSLVQFNSATPGTIARSVPVTGLQPGETLQGIDFRPATGQLYGLGSGSRLYVIDINTGAATQVGSSGAFTVNGTS